MTRTRFTHWVVLVCIGTLAACTSDQEGPAGNTELNVIIDNGTGNGSSGVVEIDVKSVEYTIVCTGGQQGAGFLDDGDTFPDAVTINGNLEVVDGRTSGGPPPVPTEVWQGFMDIPPGECLVQLRARDGDGEVICSGDNVLADLADRTVDANEFQKVDIILVCDVSFQAPVGNLDVDGTFSFVVGNFCPDLFVLNCLDTNLGLPTVPVEGQTSCEVRFRDGDNGCGQGCDPQVCVENGTTGLLECFPASPPEDQNGTSMAGVSVRTIVTCDSPGLDCDGLGGPDDTECVFDGDQLGTLAVNAGIVPNPASFGVNCGGAAAGATITCTAYTTDGDRDCDKTKVVTVDCPGLNFCDVAVPGDNLTDCDDLNDCTIDSCDRTAQACAYSNVPAGGGNNCTTGGGGPGECDGNGVCDTFGCTQDSDCDLAATVCMVAPVGACDPVNGDPNTGFCAPEVAGNEGGDCDSSTGGIGDNGTCQAGTCVDNCVGQTCSDSGANAECTQDVCTSGGGGFTCSNPPVADCTACCDAGSGAGSGDCNLGVCAEPPVLADVCQQYAPGPVNRTASCDPTLGDECICEKPQFLAADCELVGNSAPIPLQAAAQQLGVAFAGQAVNILPQDAVVLPAALVCGFIGAGFQSAEVGDSTVEITYTNANLASTVLSSFVNPAQPTPGALISPHGDVIFDFGLACGDNCAGFCNAGFCADGTTACTGTIDATECVRQETCASTGNTCRPSFIAEDCSIESGGTVGTGPGVVAPFFAGAPGSIPGTHPIPNGLVSLTPTAAGSVDIDTGYAGIRLVLPDVGGLVSGCLGGACSQAPAISSVCTPAVRGTETSPRVMYDANCTKPGFGACGGTGCDTTADCPLNSVAIGGTLPGQTCDTSAGGPDAFAGICTDVNSGTCGLVGAGLCPDAATSCGSCEDASGNTGTCSTSGALCAADIGCPFGETCVQSACAVDGDCGTGETCTLSDDRCNDVIDAISGGQIPTCCSPFGDFTSTADVCKGQLPPEDVDSAPECCDQKAACVAPCAFLPSDLFCVTAANTASCCAAIGTNYPEATPAENPQLWVRPLG